MRHVTELIVDTALSKNKEKHCHVGQLTATIHSRICMKLCCNEIYPRPVLNNLRSKMRVGQPGVHSVLCSIYNDQTRFYSLLTIRLYVPLRGSYYKHFWRAWHIYKHIQAPLMNQIIASKRTQQHNGNAYASDMIFCCCIPSIPCNRILLCWSIYIVIDESPSTSTTWKTAHTHTRVTNEMNSNEQTKSNINRILLHISYKCYLISETISWNWFTLQWVAMDDRTSGPHNTYIHLFRSGKTKLRLKWITKCEHFQWAKELSSINLYASRKRTRLIFLFWDEKIFYNSE